MGWSGTPGDNYRRTGSTLVEPRSAPTFFAQFVCYFCVFTWFLLRCHLILRSFWHAFWAPFLWFSNVIVQRVPNSHFYGFLMLLFKEFPNPIFMIFWCYCSKRSQIPFLWFSDVIVQIVLKSHFYDFLTFLICYDIFISFFYNTLFRDTVFMLLMPRFSTFWRSFSWLKVQFSWF